MKRLIALSLAAIMSVGMAVSASAANFSDINNVPWDGAKEYINSVADLGLMVGDTDSAGNKTFRAKDRITYCEAMQLAYSVLKGTDSLKTSTDASAKWKGAMQAANIPEWAYTSVAYGLESGVVSENDVKIFMKGAGENRDATRENVAVIFGKALSHISDVNTSASLTFKDKDEITASSVPYIDLLAKLEILVGDDSGNFNPKNYINRAEMAVIVSKSYNKITELKKTETPQTVGSFTGKIILTDNGTDQQTIAVSETGSGKTSTFTINASTPVINTDGEVKSYKDISLGDTVTVTTSSGVVVSVIIKDDVEDLEEEDTKKGNSLEGYLNNITSKVITFDTEDGKQSRYEFASNPRITLNGSVVSKDDLYEYVTDRNVLYVEVKLDSSGDVESLSAKFCDVEGELTNVKDSSVYVKYEYAKNNSKNVKVELGSNCEIYLDGTKISESKAESLFDEKDGGLFAKVKVNNLNKATKVEIFHDTYNNGELISISSSSIEVKSNFGRTVEYELDDDAVLTLNGSEAKYKDIKNALKSSDVLVTLEFNSKDLVIRADAQVKTAKGIVKAAESKKLAILDADENRMSLPVDRNIECTFNDEEVSYSQFQKLYKNAENAVVAVAELDDEGTVIKVDAWEGSNTEGNITSISSSKITFEDVAGIEYSYKIEPAVRGYLDGQELMPGSRIFDHAEEGMKVKVTFSSRDYVNRIYLTTKD